MSLHCDDQRQVEPIRKVRDVVKPWVFAAKKTAEKAGHFKDHHSGLAILYRGDEPALVVTEELRERKGNT